MILCKQINEKHLVVGVALSAPGSKCAQQKISRYNQVDKKRLLYFIMSAELMLSYFFHEKRARQPTARRQAEQNHGRGEVCQLYRCCRLLLLFLCLICFNPVVLVLLVFLFLSLFWLPVACPPVQKEHNTTINTQHQYDRAGCSPQHHALSLCVAVRFGACNRCARIILFYCLWCVCFFTTHFCCAYVLPFRRLLHTNPTKPH